MKSFFVVRHEVPRSIDEKYLVQEKNAKLEILQRLNIKGLDSEKYDFYDESSLSNESKFMQMYHDAIFELYFPRVKEKSSYVYYPKSKIVETPDSTVYVYRWDEIDGNGKDIQSIAYISDDSEKEEYQRVMTVFLAKPEQMENKECEQTK